MYADVEVVYTFRWLVVKNWLVQRKKKLELAPKRSWKKYWVCLKGTVLLFYDCDMESSEAVSMEDSVPKHLLGECLVPKHLLGKFLVPKHC